MKHLVTVKQHEYDGKTYRPGDRYSLDDYYARQMIYLGNCIEADEQEKRFEPEPVQEVSHTETTKTKRKYQRRDMVPIK